MTDLPAISLFGMEMTLYSLLAVLFYLAAAGAMVFCASKGKVSQKACCLYAALSGVFGLLLGRLIFCLVRMDTLFFDEMGEPLGIAPLFDPATGGVSVVGVMLGAVLAAPLCKKLTGCSAGKLMDHATLPALLFFAAMRFIEPLSGEGYGVPMEDSFLAFPPFAIINDWGEAMLSVCFIEGMLALLAAIPLCFLRKKAQKNGSLALYAALFLSVSQIIPECFRWDDVLYIIIFARVTHIGLAAMLFFSLLLPLIRGYRNGLEKRVFWLELMLMLLGLGICIGTIFALDKTNLPKLLVYAVMACTLAALAFLTCRRIHKEDIR